MMDSHTWEHSLSFPPKTSRKLVEPLSWGFPSLQRQAGVPVWNKGALNEVFIASRWDGGTHLCDVLVSLCSSETVLAQALRKYVGFKIHAGHVIY